MSGIEVERDPWSGLPGEEPVAVAVTVIVPTRNEQGNVRELLRRLEPVLSPGSEVLFVDDSDDETVSAIEAAAQTLPFPVRVHHRVLGERGDGLGGAVRAGLRLAGCDWCVVMDADLQHPPEMVPRLVEEGVRTHSQLVVATRYNGEGDAESFGHGRAAMSTWATRITKGFFPRRLANVTDPMTGFFALRRDAVDVDTLRPNGFKILLEIAVRCAPLRVVEVPFHFGRRFSGQSKASLTECVRLILVLSRLWFDARSSKRISRMVAFGLVGVSGLLLNSIALFVASGVGHLHYVWGTILATLVSTTWNWGVLEVLVYPGGARGSAARRFGAFGVVNLLALVLRVPLMGLLIERTHMHYLLANIVSLLVLFALRFAVSDTLIFRRPIMTEHDQNGHAPAATIEHAPAATIEHAPAATIEHAPAATIEHAPPATVEEVVEEGAEPAAVRHGYLPYRYEVPGVASIGSEVQLPELRWFLMPFRTRGPFDIEIRVARVGRMRGRVTFTADGSVERRYEEHLGGLGANFKLEMGETIHVTASPLLVRSPHVLYTNIVEMLLRFLAVSKGRILLHSACVQLDGKGVMLSARTDTGKTGTILRLIREQGAVFLSDDMTIIDPEGRAYCFPKPLTISHHTLRAVDSRGLSKSEWRKLRLQSRLHSKEGRSFGMRLAQMNLPIMTFNAVTQAIVPPPKYDVDRLVPCDVVHHVEVQDMFIIERGPNEIVDVPREQALTELIDNTDDAYGFPPFALLAPTLHIGGMDYVALRAREEELLGQTLEHLRVRRLARDDFGWPAEIARLVMGQEDPAPAPMALLMKTISKAQLAALPTLQDVHAPSATG